MSPQDGPRLDGRRIVVTRAEEPSGGLADRLAALGAEVIAVPLTRIGLDRKKPGPRFLVSLTTRLFPWSY